MLHGRGEIAATLFVFDVLAVEGLATTMQPYSERRELLEQLELEGARVRLVATFWATARFAEERDGVGRRAARSLAG